MKRCRDCNTVSSDSADYCRICRSTFGVRLCPQGHVNGRFDLYCSQCGSEDLSRPHRRVSREFIGFVVWAVVLSEVALLTECVYYLLQRMLKG